MYNHIFNKTKQEYQIFISMKLYHLLRFHIHKRKKIKTNQQLLDFFTEARYKEQIKCQEYQCQSIVKDLNRKFIFL